MTGPNVTTINGGSHTDERGTIRFINDLDLHPIVRFYLIEHPHTNIIRAWQGHQHESKWFYVIDGVFEIALVQPDNWQQPRKNLQVFAYEMNLLENKVLYVPGGYVNGFRAKTTGAKLMVFSDKTVAESVADDYRYPPDYWDYWK